MADFVAVLRKTLDGLGETTPETRERVYDKARSTIAAKLAAINPPPPPAVADRQRQALEDAIRTLESEFARPVPAAKPYSDPIEELESVFASLGRPGSAAPKPAPAPAVAPVAKAAPRPLPKLEPLVTAPRDVPLRQQPARELPTFDFQQQQALASEPLPPETGSIYETPRPRSRLPLGRLVGALVILALLGGAGYGLWLNRDDLAGLFRAAPREASAPATPAGDDAASAPVTPTSAPASETQKFTQRLNADGTETDAGPAGGEPTLGEGTSVASVTTPAPMLAPPGSATGTPAPAETAATQTPPTPTDAASPEAPADAAAGETSEATAADPAVPAADAPATDVGASPAGDTPASGDTAATDMAAAPTSPGADVVAPTQVETATVPVGQRAIFYEERTNVAEGSAAPGTIVWSLVQESPGGDLPPEPAIRAEATIPGKDIQLRMTIRRNADKSLPASHIIEMIFLTPDGFEGGGIDNVLRMSMKSSEQEAGNPLIGMPAKIADGFFLVALNDTKAEIDANMTLLRGQSWIDVPMVYKSGRRALITMEKGIPGDKVFDEAMKAWQAASG
jgi:hypothetical protein